MRVLVIVSAILACISGYWVEAVNERRIVVVVASYNNKNWYQKNLASLFEQEYNNFHIIYIDDASPDGTGNLVEAYVKQCGQEHRITLIKNAERMGALANHYRAIHSCNDTDIIAICDGDDWLPNKYILRYLNLVYADSSIWLTYGQFTQFPSSDKGFCCPMPADVVEQNAFRNFTHIPSHMRTFYAGLFKKIKQEDLLDEHGQFLDMCADVASMFPMIEMACNHFKFIPWIMYVYNDSNVLSDHRVSRQHQHEVDLLIRSRPRYERLTQLFT